MTIPTYHIANKFTTALTLLLQALQAFSCRLDQAFTCDTPGIWSKFRRNLLPITFSGGIGVAKKIPQIEHGRLRFAARYLLLITSFESAQKDLRAAIEVQRPVAVRGVKYCDPGGPDRPVCSVDLLVLARIVVP